MSDQTSFAKQLRHARVVKVEKRSDAVEGPARYSSGAAHVLGVLERRGLGALGEAGKKYSKLSKSSADSRRDGALRDLPENLLAAHEAAFETMIKIPRDLVRTREARRQGKRVYRVIRGIRL